MAGLTGVSNQSPRIVSGFLNGENLEAPGVPLRSPSGSIVQPYGGQVGGKLFLSNDDARKLSNPDTGILYTGVYQLIQLAPVYPERDYEEDDPAVARRGTLAFWDTDPDLDLNQFTVTQDESLNGGTPLKAGIFLNTVWPGRYSWIQVEGRATVQMRSSGVVSNRQIKWAGAGAGTDNATADGAAELDWDLIGVAEDLPTDGELAVVNLLPAFFVWRQ